LKQEEESEGGISDYSPMMKWNQQKDYWKYTIADGIDWDIFMVVKRKMMKTDGMCTIED
jgi:predicted transglutaminase-like cysteine proteinase